MTKKGFTIVELLVVVSIMVIMTSVIFFNYNKFNESTIMTSVAYDLSLTIRQAQTYSVAVRQGAGSPSTPIDTNIVSSTNFNWGYGVHFDLSTPTSFSLFTDAPTELVGGKFVGDGQYDVADDGPSLQTYSFQRGIKVAALCYDDDNAGGPPNNCEVPGLPNFPGKKVNNKLDITFMRPNPEASFVTAAPVNNDASSAKIYLQNADGSITKAVVVYSTGQISVQ